MPIVTVTAVGLYVADKLTEHLIQEEAGYRKILHYLFPPKTFKQRVGEIVDETISEFSKTYIYDSNDRQFPFYESQLFMDHMNQFVLFGKNNSWHLLQTEMEKLPKLVKPGQADLDKFYDMFVAKIKSDNEANQLFIDANYKHHIFVLGTKFDELTTIVSAIKGDTGTLVRLAKEEKAQRDNLKLSEEKMISALSAQVKRQLKKQTATGKYLKDTFIETGPQKDLLRYLCDPVFYAPKCFSELENLDLRYMNKTMIKRGLALFEYDLSPFKPDFQKLTLASVSGTVKDVAKYITSRHEILEKINDIKGFGNDIWQFQRKFRDRSYLKYFHSHTALITEAAGQGKTNFLCDFVDGFLNNRKIPTTFVTGPEINSADIRGSILKRVFPDDPQYTFADLIEIMRTYCHRENKCWVIVIDGLNENMAPDFSGNIEAFVAEISEHEFIRVVMSCRTEYYQHNFTNLERSSFSENLRRIQSLIDRQPDKTLKKKLFELYLQHFNIKHQGIAKHIRGQLTSNFLLLRIYCEVYQGQDVGTVSSIHKEVLFATYYKIKTDEINSRLKSNDEFKITGTFDIRSFIEGIVSYMIETKTYTNIPLDKIIEDPKNRAMLIRFLDENILVKRDLPVAGSGVFESEVVNFTFDEFRDFLVSRYLIDKLYKKSPSEFTAFVSEQMGDKSPVREGCSTFLFFMVRSNGDKGIAEILNQQEWYNNTYSRCVFSLPDRLTTQEDRKVIKGVLTGDGIGASVLFNLILRSDTDYYPNLNIEFLFETLRDLDDDDFQRSFSDKFDTSEFRNQLIDQKSLLKELRDIVDTDEFDKHPRFHRLFELLIYMFVNDESWKVTELYERYRYIHPDKAKVQLTTALESKGKGLVHAIKKFCKRYEINL